MMNRIACCILLYSIFFTTEIFAQRNGAYIVNDRNKSYLELRNGLLGLVIPKETTYNARDAQKTLAPIQSIIYNNGAFSDKTPNYFQGATRSQVYPSSMKVTVTKNDPAECII